MTIFAQVTPVIEAAVQAANHAEHASDRWLFLFTIIIGGILGGVAFRVQYIQSRKDREKYETFINGLYTETLKLTATVQVQLSTVTSVVSENTKLFTRLLSLLDGLEAERHEDPPRNKRSL